jgi:hypothetical protein
MEEDWASRLVTGLNNLANAAVQKNKTVEKLITMNQQKDKVIASLTKSLKEEKRTNSTLLSIISNAGLKAGSRGKNNQKTGGGKWGANLDPNGYCWPHGFKVKMGHTSMTCSKHLEGHKEGVTYANTMGGKDYNKNWKPEL